MRLFHSPTSPFVRKVMVTLHETGQMLFPGTGASTDVGGPDAQGSAVQVSDGSATLEPRSAARRR